MKIVDTEFVKHSVGTKPGGKTGPEKGDAFQKVLHDTIEKSHGNPLSPSTRQVTTTVPIHPVQLNNHWAKDSDYAVERVDQFIGLLETYQHKLSQPGATLKDLDRMIADISLEKDRLTPLMNSLEPDNGLRQILNEALVTASREIFKFQRGDYVSD